MKTSSPIAALALAACLFGGVMAVSPSVHAAGRTGSDARVSLKTKAKRFMRSARGKATVGVVTLAAVVGMGLGGYNMHVDNTVVAKHANVVQQWGGVEASLQKRYDDLNNLVKTVSAQARFEHDTQVQIAAARSAISAAQNAKGVDAQVAAANRAEVAIQPLLTLQERYPDLGTNASFQELMRTIKADNADVQVHRMYFNNAVADFNVYVQTAPHTMFEHEKPMPTFQASDAAHQDPNIDFNLNFGDGK
jgi:LemA protein